MLKIKDSRVDDINIITLELHQKENKGCFYAKNILTCFSIRKILFSILAVGVCIESIYILFLRQALIE